MNELVLAAYLCTWLGGGETEARHGFAAPGGDRYIRVDCETPTHVIELGFDDKSDSRDAVHQAVFAHLLSIDYGTPKVPAVILIDTDGTKGRYEIEIERVTRFLGVPFATCKEDFIVRWSQTAGLRSLGLDKSLDDLPWGASGSVNCDLAPVFAHGRSLP